MTGLNTNFLKAGIASIAILAAAPTLAQDMQAAPAPSAAPAQSAAPTAPSAPGSTASNYSEADIKQFAAAAVEVTKIQQDTSISSADKQPKMVAALQASGIAPEKFNEIGQAAAADPALQQRIQAAAPAAPAASSASPADPATPASPATPQQ